MSEQESIKITGYSNKSVTIGGLSSSESDQIQGAMRGFGWVRVGHDGRLMSTPAHSTLPGPIDDEGMLPFWRPATEDEKRRGLAQPELFEKPFYMGGHDPSIIIKHLCGYLYTPQRYKNCAKTLESYGFCCMRSRRARDGKYWEHWVLHGLWMAEGDLKQYIEERQLRYPNKLTLQQTSDILTFIYRRAPYGAADITVQRSCMTVE